MNILPIADLLKHPPLYVAALLSVALLWLTLSGACLLGRRRHDRLAAALARCASARPGPGAGASALAAWNLGLLRLLRTLPRDALYRLACDGAQPDWLKDALAAGALARYGARRLLREAAGRQGRRGRGNPWRRIGALHLLCQVRAAGMHALLCEALAQPDRAVAAAAVTLLGTLGDRAAAAILVGALRRNWYARTCLAGQLERFPDDVAELLLPLLDDAEPAVRVWGIRLLAPRRGLARLDARLAAHADDADAAVRKAAVQALGELGGPLAATVASRLVADTTGFVRAHAARALGRLFDPSRQGDGALVAPLLADRDWWVRLAAREALAAMGSAVWRDVAAQTHSADAFARDGAREVLRQIGADAAAASRGGAAVFAFPPAGAAPAGRRQQLS
ncbi:HEAT repeat protein [Janthinobacterium sp. CG_23.3]|uniref:HEAT repeat domain-containing protein n=1 Tax=Janthinobacterium sp. CG_23.3 TaxID=3349634 RepID=UPI0038D4CC47